MKEEKFILIDGNAIVHRAFHALPPLTSPKGQVTNAVFGFCSILIKMIRDIKPDYIAAAFDMAGPTFRHDQFDQYKAKRVKAPQELYDQIPLVKEVLSAFGIPVFEKKGYEADDVIGTLATLATIHKNLKIIIATGDMDTCQLVHNDKIVVYTMRKGFNDTVIYDEKAVMERFGLKPSQLNDYRGLKGDPSDNIPGVPGVGEKTASKLIAEYGTLEKVFEDPNLPEKIAKHKDQAFFSKQLSQIVCDLDIEFDLEMARWRSTANTKKLEELFGNFGFKSLNKRLQEIDLSVHAQPALSLEQEFVDAGMSEVYETIEKPLTPVLESMQRWGIKVDVPMLRELLTKVNREIEALEKQIYKLAGSEFNINSPSQLAVILFDNLGIVGKIRKTKGGARSTAAPELEKIREEHPIVDLILQFRELQKLKTTYIEPFPMLVDASGRVHTTYDQVGAATGRLSSSNPNLQNIPIRTPLGQEFRKAFVAERGFLLVSCDYSQIDLRMVAHLSHDKVMVDAFRKGLDIHERTAELLHITRREAKVLNFGVLYGMGALGVARAAGVSREEGKQFIEKYFAEFKGVAEYLERTKELAHKNGYVETLFGRRREIPEIRSTMPQLQAQGERMAINMPVQGTAADLIKIAMINIYKEIKDNSDVRMLLQVHDELVFEIKKELVSTYAPRLKALMEQAHTFDVPIIVDVKAGENWQEMEKIL